MLVCPALRIIFLALQIKPSEFTVTKAVVLQPALTGLQQYFIWLGSLLLPGTFLHCLYISISKYAAMGLVSDVHLKKKLKCFISKS